MSRKANKVISKCPVCKGRGVLILHLSHHNLAKYYKDNYSSSVPNNVIFNDYDIYKCVRCELEYSHPQVQGDNAYYSWITSQPNYYPKSRWEWNAVIKLRNKNDHHKLLEVGCGEGDFLKICDSSHIDALGIDLTKSAIDIAVERGLNARCTTLEQEVESNPAYYDDIAAFHLLEHVPYPLQFVKIMLKGLKPDGNLFISTPYISHSDNNQWFDLLNYPPHHLTRWNAVSYIKLAEELDLNIKFYMPRTANILSRTLNSLALTWIGPEKYQTIVLKDLLLRSIKNPKTLFKELNTQLNREKIFVSNLDAPEIQKKQVANYVILVQLSRKR